MIMSEFNKIERKLASFLSKFPIVKNKIKYIYSYVSYLLNKSEVELVSDFDSVAIKYNDDETFFGYYDHSPLSENGKNIIFNSTSYDTSKNPSHFDIVNICLYNVSKKESIKLTETRAFNWQQGSRLIWLNDDSFIYNDYENDCYISKVYSLEEDRVISKFDRPIYDVNGHIAVSIDFRRLTALRPDYGYFSHDIDGFILNDEALKVELIDLDTGSINLLFDFDKYLYKTAQTFNIETIHKFNHLMLSPSGKKLMFIHRYYSNNIRHDRLVCYSLELDSFDILTSVGIVSHCFWYDDNNIYGYFTDHNSVVAYNKVNLLNKEIIKISDKLDNLGDGHPNIINKEKMVSDTYPNKSRMKELFIYDFDDDKKTVLASIFEPIKFFGESRCDLHPRFSYDANYVFFDSVHTGKRHLYMMRSK